MKLKKILAAALSLTLVCGAVTAVNSYTPEYGVTASAADEEYTEATDGYLTYKVYSNYAEVASCDKEATGKIEILDEINGMPVIAIETNAFLSCTYLEEITIPESIRSIGVAAFWSCTALKSVVIPESVTAIEYQTFFGCTSLETVTIPESITTIGSSAFNGCTNLDSIIIPKSVENIRSMAFWSCSDLKSITILNSDCEIDNDPATICSAMEDSGGGLYIYHFTGTIYGYSNSTAQAYAEQYDYEFVSLGEAPAETTTTTTITTTTTTTTVTTTTTTEPTTTTTQKTTIPETTEPPVTTTTTAPDEPVAVSYGDPNGDGKIDANDATFVLIEYAKLSTGRTSDLTEEEQSAADINKDGKVDSKDSSIILGYYSYLSTGGTDSLENYITNN